MLSLGVIRVDFCVLTLGSRLVFDLVRRLEESFALVVTDANEDAGDPAERGWETQSSERESNQAWSILSDGEMREDWWGWCYAS